MNWETGGDRRSLVCVTRVMSEACCAAQGPLSVPQGDLSGKETRLCAHIAGSLCCAAEISMAVYSSCTRMVLKRHGKLDRKSKI